MQVTIQHLFISPGHNYFGRHGKGSKDFPIEGQEAIKLVAGRGIVNDRFFDYEPDYKGQITFFDSAVYEAVKSEMGLPDLDPSKFRRNVMLEGADLNALIGKKFSLNGITFSGSCESKPCYWMDEACKEGTEKFLRGNGGLRARILDDGELRAGEYELEILGDL